MHPTLVREPFHRAGWVYEEKTDGWRIVAYKDGERVRLLSRNGVNPHGAVPRCRCRGGPPQAEDPATRRRGSDLRPAAALALRLARESPDEVATPPVPIPFDALYVRGHDISQKPLRERRARLEKLLDGADRVHPVRRLASNGLEAWAEVLERGYEGLVAKDDASPNRAGKTTAWLKVKVPGWTDSEDRWRRTLTTTTPGRTPDAR